MPSTNPPRPIPRRIPGRRGRLIASVAAMSAVAIAAAAAAAECPRAAVRNLSGERHGPRSEQRLIEAGEDGQGRREAARSKLRTQRSEPVAGLQAAELVLGTE